MGRADLVRRAMSKKKHDVMTQERKNFIYGQTDDDGNDIFDEASGVMVKNDSLASAMAEQGDNTLTNDEISNNLKKELLSLIKFNDSPVVVDGVVDSVTLSRYSIEVIKDGSYYKITYTYTGTSATYTRTLTMSAS